MAAAGKEHQERLAELDRQHRAASSQLVAAEKAGEEASKMLAHIEEKKRNALFHALDSMKKRYLHRLLGARAVKVLAPKASGGFDETLGKGTTIPKISDPYMHEIEVLPTLENFSYVRVLYNTQSNEYFYEVIEPKLLEEEAELLEVLKEILVENLELDRKS